MEKAHVGQQYAYRANANLVLTTSERSRDLGPSGEVMTLAGRMSAPEMVKQMGERAGSTKSTEHQQRVAAAKKKRERLESGDASERPRTRTKATGHESVLSEDVDSMHYRPQTKETKQVYEVLLGMIQTEAGVSGGTITHDLLRSLADETLFILKQEKVNGPAKKKELESLFGRGQKSYLIREDVFSKLVNTVTKITDYKNDIEQKTANEEKTAADLKSAANEDEQGVSVVFAGADDRISAKADAAAKLAGGAAAMGDGEKEDLDGKGAADDDEVRDADDDDENNEGKVDASEAHQIGTKDGDDDDGVGQEEKKDDLDVHAIDAFWLQRQISTFQKDATEAQKFSEDVLKLMSASDKTDGQVENELVVKFDFQNTQIARQLMKNRWKVVYCTKLARAGQDSAAKKQIEEEMSASAKLKPILEALHRTATAAERQQQLEAKLADERRRLKGAGAADAKLPVESKKQNAATDAFWQKRPKAALDLETLAFEKAGHMMSNAECKLPPNTKQITKKGYRTVFVPAQVTRENPDEKYVTVDSMPAWARPPFSEKKITKLNRIQSRVYPIAMQTAENMLVCAPTGAGKTNIAMLAILHQIGLHRNKDTGVLDLESFKIVYVAPMKSLVQEMVLNFSQRLKSYGIQVKELSGDQQLSRQQIAETQVIVTTPEKWDIITRKAGDRTFTQLVKLIIIDEIHLLHDNRGPVLESIVARTIRQIETTQELVRLVGLSATLPNYEDVAMFLRVKPDKGLFFFDGSFRPVPLQQQYIGITEKKAFKKHQIMDEIVYEKTITEAGKNQVLIFVHSRKDTINTANFIKKQAEEKGELNKFMNESGGGMSAARREILESSVDEAKSPALKALLPFGFGVHHAGMTRADRTLVEDLMADGHIQVLVSTATLAWGVNLPAHTIIIKGTEIYSPEKGRWVQLSPMDVLQMCGRAGRPQYDTFGEAVIVTGHKEMQYYLSLLNEQLPVESQLISRFPDMLNAEIVLGSVSNVREAVNWLGYTYLYVRMLRRPTLYGISVDDYESDKFLEQRRVDLVHTAASLLDKHNLIKYDRKTGAFQVTDLGRTASYYYISYTSMAVYNDLLKPQISDIELLRVFSMSTEFKYMTVREEEKLELAKLLDKVPVPVKESIEENTAKVNVLLQTYISRLKLDGFSLIADMTYVTQSAGRVMRALFEIVLKRGWAAAAAKTLNVCKMINHRMWTAQSALRQFKTVPQDVITRLEGKDFPFERLYDLEAHALGELVRVPKVGAVLHKAVHQIPKLNLECHVQPITRAVLRCELSITPDFAFDEKVHGNSEPFWIIVEDVDGETILHHEYFVLRRKFGTEKHTVNFTVAIFEPMPPQYYIRVMSDRWIGSENVLPISFRHLLLPDKYPAPTELLDLQPLAVTELAAEKYIKFYRGTFDYFNPIQTQVFNTVYKKDTNMLVAAPTGSGKTAIAELAIFRMLSNQPKGRCVYIAPLEALVQERYADWKPRFAALGVTVALLTGDAQTDMALMQQNRIVIATPIQYDILSRRWRIRKPVQAVTLLIADELHLIGSEEGAVLEVVISRQRYMTLQLNTAEAKEAGTPPMRIVALSASIANASDLGEWIGAPANATYAFQPNVRPVPLEIRIQGFDIPNFTARQLAMVKPTYSAIKELSPNKPVIVFAPSRKQCRKVATDLLAYAASEEEPTQFLHAELKDIEPQLATIKNRALDGCLRSGIGFYHKGLTDAEKLATETLFRAGAVQVLVVDQAMCWGMGNLWAHLVVIMGTQIYDGTEHRYVDVPISTVLQMQGRASRPLLDSSAKCSIFCVSSKKEFYKKFLYDPLPIESHLDHSLHDHLNAEIISKRIESVQDAVDYLTWSFMYRRITQNPNYYNLAGTTNRHMSDHLSELVENTLDDLSQAKMIELNDTSLSALNLGMIASFYYLQYQTVELFASTITKKSKLKGLLAIMSAAAEFNGMSVRSREDIALQKLARHMPWKIDNPNYFDAHTKTNILLQSHFSRVELTAALVDDIHRIVPDASRLLQAMVDVISSNGWLTPALACMELSQMITQAQYNTDSVLLQLPHFTKQLAATCHDNKIDTINDLVSMEDADRNKLLKLKPAEMADIADFANRYPDIDVRFEVTAKGHAATGGDKLAINVELVRDADSEDAEEITTVPLVCAPRYGPPKVEGWWLAVGNPATNQLLSLKRVTMRSRSFKIKLDFETPNDAGKHNLVLSLMSDSYMGVDQEYPFEVTVATAAAKADDAGAAMIDDEPTAATKK